jgi:hypothetical protein
MTRSAELVGVAAAESGIARPDRGYGKQRLTPADIDAVID